MKQQFLVNNIKEITNTPEFIENFLNQFKDCFEVKSHFGKCQVDIPSETVVMSIPRFYDSYEVVEIKIKSFSQSDGKVEFYSKEDCDLFRDNHEHKLIRMIVV